MGRHMPPLRALVPPLTVNALAGRGHGERLCPPPNWLRWQHVGYCATCGSASTSATTMLHAEMLAFVPLACLVTGHWGTPLTPVVPCWYPPDSRCTSCPCLLPRQHSVVLTVEVSYSFPLFTAYFLAFVTNEAGPPETTSFFVIQA